MSRREAIALCLAALVAGAATRPPTVLRDLSYGADPGGRRTLDLYVPSPDATGARPERGLPVVVYVHGGGWFKGDKERVGDKPQWLAELGFVLVSVNYRLLPAGRHPSNAEDVATAVAWVRRSIADHGGDPRAIFLLGHSAGAHLAALVATDERFLAAHGLALDALAGVVALDTDCYDVESHVLSLAPEDRGLYLAAFGRHRAGWRDASPRAHVAPGKPIPPFLLLTAGEPGTTRDQTAAFARALEGAGATVRAEDFPRETHGSINGHLGRPGHAPTVAIERFLAAQLREPESGSGQ